MKIFSLLFSKVRKQQKLWKLPYFAVEVAVISLGDLHDFRHLVSDLKQTEQLDEKKFIISFFFLFHLMLYSRSAMRFCSNKKYKFSLLFIREFPTLTESNFLLFLK